MRFWKKILFIFVAVILLLFICLHVYVNIKGKYFLIKKLKETFNREVKVGSVTTSFPINIYVKEIEVSGLLKIDEVFAGGGVFDIFRQSFSLSLLKVIRPTVIVEKNIVKSTAEAFIPAAKEKTDTPNLNPLSLPQNKFLSPVFVLRRLIVKDGTFNFTDKSISDKGVTIKIKNMNIKVDNLNLSGKGSHITSFDLKGTMPWQEGQEEGKIEARGWIDLFKKDMQATLKIQDIDGISLYPYYSNWVDLEKARIEKAKLNFSSDIRGADNDITAQCHLELADIVRRPRAPEETETKAAKITDAVLDIFRALNQGKIVLDFTIKTKMDTPAFGFGDIRTAFEDKLTQRKKTNIFDPQYVLSLPAKLLEGLVRGATDVSKAVVDGTFAVGDEIKKRAEDTFKKEPDGSTVTENKTE